MPGIWAVVPAAGRGTRFGSETPKQYLQVAGQPLIAYTLAALLTHPVVEGVMVAISDNDADWPGWTTFADKPVLTCTGGATRAPIDISGSSISPPMQDSTKLRIG